MILFLYIYISLYVINISKCEFWQQQPGIYDKNKIHLIAPEIVMKDDETVDSYSFSVTTQLNKKFHDMCSDFYDIEFVKVESINRVKKALELAKEGRNVIDLFGPYHRFIDDDSQNIIYAGALIAEDKMQDVLTSNFIVNNDTQGESYDDAQSTWMTVKSPLSGVKIMSKTATEMNSGDLFDFVMKIEYTSSGIKTRKTCLETNILKINRPLLIICLDKHQSLSESYSEENLNLKFVYNDCTQEISKYKDHLIAILAPKPFEFDTELKVPTIFYDTPYLNSEYISRFPNSMNLINGMLLKYAFIKLIEDYGWERVAIISDDSPYSIELEHELVELFKEKRIIYNVQRCEERKCDFKKAVINLRKMKAKIVIANVNEDNAKEINEHNEYLKKYIFHLIFRVPPFKVNRNHYFITLGPSDNQCFSHHDDNTICTVIMKGIHIVDFANMVTAHYRQDSLSLNQYYSDFAAVMLQHKDTDAVATVSTRDNTLLSMYINANGVNSQSINTKVKAPKIPIDNFDGCFLKSNDFVRYCNVSIILFIMLLVVMFAIMTLTISCYFHKTSPINANKYQQF